MFVHEACLRVGLPSKLDIPTESQLPHFLGFNAAPLH